MKKNPLKIFLIPALMALCGGAARGQSPGGITTDPALWYLPTGATASGWADSSVNGLNLEVATNGTMTVNAGDAKHNFNTWTSGYSATNYYRYTGTTNPVFGAWNDGGGTTTASTDYSGGYYFMPITIFGAARPTSNANGEITGIDNEINTGAEPGLGVHPVGGNLNPRFYRFGNGIDQTATSMNAPIGQTSIFMTHPFPGSSTSATGNLVIGLNGKDTAIANQNGRSSVAGPYLKIGYDGFTFGAFPGDIQEVIWYKATLNADDINKVETYLAIKYGTTLTHDYVDAAGNTIFDLTANAGNTYNIAGIGNESVNGGLDQKQSNSVNTGKQVLIGTTGLDNNNEGNTTSLSNGQFLVWGDNGMARTPSVAISNVPGINFRFASVWKVQNTGSVGTVRIAWPQNTGFTSFKLLQSADSTFASGNTATDITGNTQIINGVTYNYADVTLTDGQYFTFGVEAQSPGGIAALPAVWYRSENVTTDHWKDASVNTLDLTNENGGTVNAGDQAHNFHTWTTGYSNTSYYNYLDSTVSNTNLEANPVFGNYSDSGYAYMPISIFGVARATSAQAGLISGIDNDNSYGAEPGLGVNPSGGNLYPRFYRFGNGIDNTASSRMVTLNQSSVYYARPYPGSETASGNNNLVIGLNGLDTVIANTNPRSSVAGPYLSIGYSAWAFGAFQGDIQDVIWYKDTLNASDKQKVETYLAINYGTTLAHNYVNAAGDTIYNLSSADSNYRYNIAGIGSEAANGGLDQRQSNSVNTGSQVLIGTTGLANTNDSNATALTDGQFLVWGDNGLAKQPAVAITNVPGTNFRFAAVWKAHNIGAVGTVRVAWPATWAALKLVQNSDSTFASGNTVTDMTANTQTINGVTYNYADVTLADGQYFTFAAFVQAPGGVADGLLMWHRADDGTATAGAKDIWQDVSGNGRDVTQNNDTAYQPKLYTDAIDSANSKAFFFNYNPFYYFDGTNDFFYRLNDDYFPADTSAGTTYGVMFNTANGGWNTPYGWGDDDPNLVRAGDNYQVWRDNGTTIDQNIGASSLPAMIGGMGWKGSGTANNGMYLNVNGKVYSTPSYNIGTIDNNDHNFAIGSEGFALTGAGNEHFQGGIAEVFAYSKDYQNDTTDAKQRINSYLAIKYGITLSNDSGNAVPDYLSSTSQVVWDATANAGYNNNIAGIAYDYNSGLQQKQSVSENSGKQVLIGTTGLDSTNAANATALTTDGQFLVWGDNGLAKAPSVYLGNTFSTVNVRFSAIWKVANTGSVGTVRVAWPAGLNDLSLIQSADTTFDASDVITGMAANTQDINGVTYNYADVTLANGEYFTFATKIEHAPGGVFAGLSYWYRADKDAVNTGDSTDVTAWTDYATGTVVGQVGTNSYPLYHAGNATYLNFNPGINFTDGNQSLGNLSAQAVSDTAYDIFTLTKEGITAGGANARVFSVLSSRSNPTGSIHYWDGIGLNYDSRVERYNTSSGLSYLGNPGNVNFAGNSPSIMAYTFTDHTVIKGLNGAAAGNPANSGPYGIIDGGFIFGSTVFSGNGSDNYSLKGSIGETIVYGSRNLSPVERNKVNSYLAIKYGVTMDTASSYITADSTIVWDKDADQDFYHNIAGIGRDDISALYQKQSRSQITNNPNNEVAIGLGDIYATNFDNTDSVNDGQFLVWGDNGNTQAMTNTASTYATFTYNGSSDNRRMKRVWKVRNTDVVKAVKLRFPVASVGTTTLTGEDACTNYAIVYASDSAFTSNVTVAPLTVNGTDYEALHSFPQGASYFTFAKVLQVAAGVVVLPASTQTTTEYNQCATDGWRYFNQTGVPADKLLALKGMNNTQLDNLTITISPTGANYDDGNIVTNVMPRISTVTDVSAGTYSGVDVRVYYSDTELNNTQLPGAITDSWIKYEGDAGDAVADIQDDGVFTQGMATALTPDSAGTEDGVRFVEFHNVSSFSSFLYVSSSEPIGIVLPIRLLSFTAVRNNQSVLLNWATASEQNSKGFEVEHSTDGAKWNSLGFITSKAQNGNSTEPLSYAYTDAKPIQAINYYRLKEVSFDGKYEYSEIRMVDFDNEMHISIYPNPVKENVTIAGLKGKNTIYVSNSVGQVIIREASADTDTKELSTAQLASGVYMITVQDENNHKYNFKMVKQ